MVQNITVRAQHTDTPQLHAPYNYKVYALELPLQSSERNIIISIISVLFKCDNHAHVMACHIPIKVCNKGFRYECS